VIPQSLVTGPLFLVSISLVYELLYSIRLKNF
jgi:hypothetical protein